mgnify:FL=1
MTPRVTVLMPVYNGEKHLKEAIESILNQTFNDFEFLIINDGSTDDSEKIILSYSDPRIHLFNQENQGLSNTLNKGIKLSSGEFIARMDQDDISLSSRLDEQIKFMDANPDVGICGTYAILINERGEGVGRAVYPSEHEDIKAQLLFSSSVVHPSVVFRKNIFINHNLEYTSGKSEDYDLWVRAVRVTKLVNINKFLFKYRADSGYSNILQKQAYLSSAHQIIKKNILELDNFSESDMVIYEKMYDPECIPDKKFLKTAFSLLNKIRQANFCKNIYNKESLDLIFIIKWFYICVRIKKVKMIILPELWKYTIILFFRLKISRKINLIKIIQAKLFGKI